MLRICGHHVFNLIWAHGMGKEHLGDETNDFIKVFREVMGNPSVAVEVIIGVDDVCGQCKDNVDGKCLSYDGTVGDRKVIGKLGISPGDVMKWSDLVKLIAGCVRGEDDFVEIFGQGALESRFSFFKDGMEKLVTTSR